MKTKEKTLKEIIEQVVNSGLFSHGETEFFSWRGCDYCADGLGASVMDCWGYLNLEEAKKSKDNIYNFQICPECLYKLYYGEQ